MTLGDFALRCGWPERHLAVRSRLEFLGLLVKCRRCGGSGVYRQNPADSRCYGCLGEGMKLPPLTARLAADVRRRIAQGDLKPYYAANRERLRAKQGIPARSGCVPVSEIVEYVTARKA